MPNEDALIDANIFIGIPRKRKGWRSSAAALAEIKKRKSLVSALTIAIAYFINLRSMPPQKARQKARELIDGLRLAPVTEEGIDVAFDKAEIEDFEDAIQFYCAKAVDKSIITRNEPHYASVSEELEIITAEKFLTKYFGTLA